MLFYVIAIIVVLIDQITKILVRIHVEMHERFTWWGIEFTYIENSGMAGGLFPGYARLFGIVAVLFVIGVLYFRRSEDLSGPLINSSLGFLVGGAIGNGIDRLLFGEVTDFIVRSGGILNIADHAIEIGVILLLVYVLISWLKSKKWHLNKQNKKEDINLIATIEKIDQLNTAVYKRKINHSVAEVWSYLTENAKLKQWFSELEIKDLKPGGEIHFDLGDGNHERIEILGVEPNRLFAFTWPPKNSVRFELSETEDGCCELLFIEFLHEVDEHTARDLTGWHVCLDVIEALLEGETIENRKSEWELHYPAYQRLIQAAR